VPVVSKVAADSKNCPTGRVPLHLKLESLPAWVSIEPTWRRFDEERTQADFRVGQGGDSQAAFGGQGAGVGLVR
jgi:hypothetical protein